MSRELLGWAALAFGVAGVAIYFVVLAMRPRVVRILNGSGLFFTGLGLIQASIWVRDSQPKVAWVNAELAVAMLCIAVMVQGVSVVRNRKAWDGVERRAAVAGEGA
jgi:hypothetical protein